MTGCIGTEPSQLYTTKKIEDWRLKIKTYNYKCSMQWGVNIQTVENNWSKITYIWWIHWRKQKWRNPFPRLLPGHIFKYLISEKMSLQWHFSRIYSYKIYYSKLSVKWCSSRSNIPSRFICYINYQMLLKFHIVWYLQLC